MSRAAGDAMRQRILDAIAHLTEANGVAPTNREIGLELGGKSTGHVDYHLRYMIEHGMIAHEPRKSRGIRLLVQPAGMPGLCATCAHLRAENAELRARLAELQARSERAS